MLSRVAENIYWLGRYVERAENIARLTRVNGNLLLDLPVQYSLGWTPFLKITGTLEEYRQLYDNDNEKNIVNFLLFDAHHNGSLLNTLNSARWNARQVREVLPNKSWRIINEAFNYCQQIEIDDIENQQRRLVLLNRIINVCQHYQGCLGSLLNRDVVGDFLYAGIYIERADMISRAIDSLAIGLIKKNDSPSDDYNHLSQISLLKSLGAYQNYQRARNTHLHNNDDGELASILTFLMQNRLFPRSLYFCVGSLIRLLHQLPKLPTHSRQHHAITIEEKNIKTLLQERTQLSKRMDDIQIHLQRIHHLIVDMYF